MLLNQFSPSFLVFYNSANPISSPSLVPNYETAYFFIQHVGWTIPPIQYIFFVTVGRKIDPSHKSHNASDKYPTMHHFVTEMCTFAHFCYKMVHCGIWDWCIVRFVQQIYCRQQSNPRLIPNPWINLMIQSDKRGGGDLCICNRRIDPILLFRAFSPSFTEHASRFIHRQSASCISLNKTFQTNNFKL